MTDRLLRTLLALAPMDFRRRYGAEVLGVHEARRAEARGVLARVALGAREVIGLAMTVASLRLRGVGGTETTRTGGGGMMDGLAQDLRFAGRTLRRNPGFTAAAVAVLALGIGANTAIFSAADAFLFRPLPFGHPDRLVMLYETNPEYHWTHETAAPANVLDWRDQVAAFADVAAYTEFVSRMTYIHDGEPELVGVNSVTGNFFDVLDVRPEVGRGFTWDETWQGDDNVVVLSHAFWMSHFGGDPSVVGRTLDLGSASPTIVGVMPESFRYPSPQVDVWAPWGWDRAQRQAVWFRRAHWVRPVARLKPGITPQEADAAFQVVVRRLQKDFPETNRVMGAGLMPLRDFLVMDVRSGILVLGGAVALLLLLACTNVANLMLVRASDRAREVALRVALGARRARVVRQMLVEGLALAVLGGALGLGLGWAGVRLMASVRPIGIPGATDLALDGRVVLFTLATSVGSGLLFALVPALRSAAGDVQTAIKDGGGGGGAGRGTLRAVGGLVAVEVGLAVLLVAGAGLMVRTALALRDVDPGIRADGVVALQISVPSSRYPNRDQVLAFQEDVERRLAARPGVSAVGLVSTLPLTGRGWTGQVQAYGWPVDKFANEVGHRQADPGYFDALEVPLVRGRLFGPQDGPDAPRVVLVNETFARELFPGEDPVGKRIANDKHAMEHPDSVVWFQIIGVVGDQRQISPAVPTLAEILQPADQDWDRTRWFVVRSSEDAGAVVATAKDVLHEVDPLVPMGTVRPMREVWKASVAQQDFILMLLTVFGVVALLLAAVGVYGVTSQAARKRTREIGIRMALGAAAPDVVGLMLRQGLRVVAVGLLGGLIVSLLATRVMRGLLFGIEPTDPITFVAAMALLAGVAAVACYVPARRATGVDPVTSLREE